MEEISKREDGLAENTRFEAEREQKASDTKERGTGPRLGERA